jgi:hypothetical protein
VWSCGFLEKQDDNSEEVGEVPRQPEDVHCAALSKQTSPITLQQKKEIDGCWLKDWWLNRYGTLSCSVSDPEPYWVRIYGYRQAKKENHRKFMFEKLFFRLEASPEAWTSFISVKKDKYDWFWRKKF